MIRQGDFLLISVAEMPPSAQPEARDQGRAVVGYGEVTGHHHSFAPDAPVELFTNGVERWAVIEGPAVLEHQEHHALTIPQGIYKIVQQRQFTSATVRPVRD